MAKVTQQEYQKANAAINKEYTSDSIQNYTNAYNKYISEWMGTQDAFNKASSLLVKNQASTPTPSTPQKTVTQTTPTPTPTPTKTETPTTTTPTKTGWVDVAGIKNMWDNLSYDEQQKYLGQYKWLQESLTAKGITNKAKPGEAAQTTPTTTTTPTTPTKKDEWDYQDSSEWRIYEIAWHLNDYRVSQPNLFNDWETFSNFFIDWKDRNQEQLNYLRDYYNAVKKYNSLDNMTADTVGDMMVNWTIPDDYLNYVKYSNPQRYSEILDAKDRATNKIKDSASMDTIKSMEWETDTTTSKSIEWLKSQWLFVDKDWNLIDDRTENYASEEENKYLKQLADLAATNLDIDNTVKHTYDDLVERYPWATKATLMAMAQDMNSDLLREKENNLVEMTRLQGYVWYMQSERQEMNKAGSDAIAQLEKDYWMYYQYSPEWMAELVEAQYAISNPTLEQADSWTDAQKQIALKNVLDWYYDKYWDIIERSEWQVINDVMKLAKDKGISLNDALEENFLQYLRAKPGFKQLNTATSSNISWTKIWEDADGNAVYWFVDTYNKTVTPYWNASSSWTAGNIDTSTRWGKAKSIQEIVRYDWTDDLQSVVSDIYSNLKWQNYEECWYLVNDYYKAVTWDTSNLITWTFDDRKWFFTKNTPSEWDVVLFDWTNSPTASDKQKKYWHVGIVESLDDTGMRIVDANWDWKWTVDRRHINYNDPLYQERVYGFYSIPESKRTAWWGYDYDIQSPEAVAAFEEFNKLWKSWLDTTAKQKRAKELYSSLNTDERWFKVMADAYWDKQNADQAYNNIKLIDRLIDDIDKLPDLRTRDRLWTPNSYGTLRWTDWSYWLNVNLIREFGMDDEELAEYNKWASDYDMLMSNLMYDKYQDIKSTWGTFWSMSNAEWDNLKQAATNLKFNQDEQTYLANLKALRNEFQNLATYWSKWSSNWTTKPSWNRWTTLNVLLSNFQQY